MDTGYSAEPDLTYKPKEPMLKVKFLWKWSFLFLLVLVAWGMWQCGSALRLGSRLADSAVQQFHRHLNAAEYEAICAEAAEGFCASGADGEVMRFLKGVHEKLGASGAATRGNINVNTSGNGALVTVVYNTTFAIGPAVETFTWIKNGSTLKLYGYNIQSNALFLH